MDKHFEKEMEDHYPVSGMIQFTYGESANLRSDTLTFKPEVGQFLIFPVSLSPVFQVHLLPEQTLTYQGPQQLKAHFEICPDWMKLKTMN